MENFAIYKTEIGYFIIKYENAYLTYLKKLHYDEINDFGVKTEFTDKVFNQLLEYLNGKRKKFEIQYKLNGTEFQKNVWNALCDIPYGETRSYKEIAIAVGNEKASRAVGMANNKNPINIIIPCHRVIGVSGKLVGYAGGISMKEFLIKMEEKNK